MTVGSQLFLSGVMRL